MASTAKQLKAAILQRAIEGKLVKQNPNDEPVSELLKRIKAAKNAKDAKKSKPLPPITDDEKPFQIPDSWQWVRLGEICHIEMGQSPDGSSINKQTGIEFHQGKIFFTDKFIAVSTDKTTAPSKLALPNSVLLCVRAPVGKVNIVSRQICIGRGLCAITPLCGMSVEFIFNWLTAFEDAFNNMATGSTFKAISKEIVYNQAIPLPPLAEQKRIVEKIESLQSLCRKLAKTISKEAV